MEVVQRYEIHTAKIRPRQFPVSVENMLLLLQLLSALLGLALPSPNIVLILTDDQDVFLDGMTPLVKTRQLLGEQAGHISVTSSLEERNMSCL